MSNKNEILYRLPFLKDSICPFCGEIITRKKEAHLLISDLKGTQKILYKTTVPYCEKCGVPYATKRFLNQLKYETGRWPEMFTSKNRKKCLSSIGSIPRGLQKQLDIIKRELPFQIIEGYKPKEKEIITIICNHSFLNNCPICGYTLIERELFIPVALTHQAIMCGAYCSCCKRFLTRHSRWSIHKLLDGNSFAECFIFDEHDPADDIVMTERKKRNAEILRQYRLEQNAKEKAEAEAKRLWEEKLIEYNSYFESHPSTVFILIADYPDGERIIRIIDKKAKESRNENIFRYDTETGREFLSAAFAFQRDKTGTIDGQTFRITEAFQSPSGFYTGRRIKKGDDEIICIGRDGGNSSSVFHNRDCVLADLLLYSPFTKRFEIMPSTYNKNKHYYYTDIWHYREFVRKFGKPDISPDFIPDRSISEKGKRFSDLNVESFLKAYGYTVNQNDSFSAQYRQNLLAEVVDLEFLTIRQICDYLDFFIKLHPTDKYEIARSRWEEDLKFISKYKYNPNRFLIAQR